MCLSTDSPPTPESNTPIALALCTAADLERALGELRGLADDAHLRDAGTTMEGDEARRAADGSQRQAQETSTMHARPSKATADHTSAVLAPAPLEQKMQGGLSGG